MVTKVDYPLPFACLSEAIGPGESLSCSLVSVTIQSLQLPGESLTLVLNRLLPRRLRNRGLASRPIGKRPFPQRPTSSRPHSSRSCHPSDRHHPLSFHTPTSVLPIVPKDILIKNLSILPRISLPLLACRGACSSSTRSWETGDPKTWRAWWD